MKHLWTATAQWGSHMHLLAQTLVTDSDDFTEAVQAADKWFAAAQMQKLAGTLKLRSIQYAGATDQPPYET